MKIMCRKKELLNVKAAISKMCFAKGSGKMSLLIKYMMINNKLFLKGFL
jgi:hypothetical protein